MEPMHMAILAILIGLLVWFMMTTPSSPAASPVPTKPDGDLTDVLSELDVLLDDFDEIESEDEEAYSNPDCNIEFAKKIETIEQLSNQVVDTLNKLSAGTLEITVGNLVLARNLFKQVRHVIQCARTEIRSEKSKGKRPAMRKSLKEVARVAKNKAKRSRNQIRRRLNERSPGWRATL